MITFDTFSIEALILKLLAKLHVVSSYQLPQLLSEFTLSEINNAVNSLKKVDYLYIKDYEIPTPHAGKITKSTKQISVLTYALNFKSRQYILRNFPILKYYRRSNPQGLRYKNRIYHDLLIVESLIYLKERYQIEDIFNEEYLQRRQQTMSDLLIKIDNQNRTFSFLNCEVVVSNTKKDIENKPNNTLFFTYSSYQSDIISSIKPNSYPVILSIRGDDIVKQKPDFDIDDIPNHFEYFHYLKAAGGALTASALAVLMQKDPARTASICRQLEENSFLFSDRIHQNIEKPAGNRTKIYADDRRKITEKSDRVYALMLSDLIITNAENAVFAGANKDNQLVLFNNKNGTQSLYFIDNSENSVVGERTKYKLITEDSCFKDCTKYYKFCSEKRYNEFLELKKLAIK